MFMLLLLKLSQGVQVMYLDIYVQQSRLNLDNVNKKKKYGKLLWYFFDCNKLIGIWMLFNK